MGKCFLLLTSNEPAHADARAQNFIRSLKYTHDDRYPKLAFPHNLEGDSADKSISEHPHFNEFKEGLRHALHSHNVPTGVPEG